MEAAAEQGPISPCFTPTQPHYLSHPPAHNQQRQVLSGLTGEESSRLPGERPGSCLIVVSSCRGSSTRLGRVDFNGREPAEPAVIVQRCSGAAQNTWNNGQMLAERDTVVNPEILWTSEGETPEQETSSQTTEYRQKTTWLQIKQLNTSSWPPVTSHPPAVTNHC